MRTSIFFSALMISALIIFFGCTKDQNQVNVNTPAPVEILKVKQDIQKTLREIQSHQGVSTNVQTRVAGAFIVVPAGSVDALKQALSDAGVGGVVYLRAGTHTENSNLVVKSQAIIVGEDGAVLKIKSVPSVNDSNGVTPLNPAIHFLNAPSSAILNLSIVPLDGDGSTGILYENSPLSASMYNKLTGFQYSIEVEKSDNPVIIGNTIVASTLRTRGGIGAEFNIAVMNGSSAYIAQNESSGGSHGIFVSDKYGTITQNYTHNNGTGISLCRIIPNSFRLPNGQTTGANTPTANWKVNNNRAENNTVDGFVIINGASGNLVENNSTTGNGKWDFELAGITNRAGVPFVASFNNTVSASATQSVKDCGNNNTINGGVLDKVAPCN